MLNFVTLWIPRWKLYFYGTYFQITVIKKDIILSEQDIGSFFYSFLKREYKSDRDLQNYARRKGLLWQAHSGGVLKFWVGYGSPAQSFNHHPITKPEKTKICNLCLNHLFLGLFFFKQISTFYHVNWDA